MERRVVVQLLRERERRPRPCPAERPPRPARGRAWINGREVGGADPRYEHLTAAYD